MFVDGGGRGRLNERRDHESHCDLRQTMPGPLAMPAMAGVLCLLVLSSYLQAGSASESHPFLPASPMRRAHPPGAPSTLWLLALLTPRLCAVLLSEMDRRSLFALRKSTVPCQCIETPVVIRSYLSIAPVPPLQRGASAPRTASCRVQSDNCKWSLVWNGPCHHEPRESVLRTRDTLTRVGSFASPAVFVQCGRFAWYPGNYGGSMGEPELHPRQAGLCATVNHVSLQLNR